MAVSQQDPRTEIGNDPEWRTEYSAPVPPPARRSSHRHSGASRGWLAASAAVLIVVVVVGMTQPPGAPARQLSSTAEGTINAAPADPQAAIQAVIQQANSEQAQALASGNPALMSDTASAAYYRQLVQLNQGLAAQGGTRIELSQLSWGPISINGSTATATTSETWVTTFSDGTTTESTDANVYTLVQQGGTWLIEADQNQPATSASAQPTPGVGAPPTPQTPVAVAPVSQNTSHNWSGYAATATTGRYTGVSGTWTVPQPRISGAAGVGATWVGIGGVNSHDLIQAGTQDVAAGGGQAQFQTWIEMLPQASQQVPLSAEPGDSVTVSIDAQGAGTGVWQISMKNNTSGQTYQTTVQYASSESSAEWVEEAPSGSSGVLPLDQFNSVSFSAALNGLTVPGADPAVAFVTHTPDQPNYPARLQVFLQGTIPDLWNGQSVQFWSAYSAAGGSDMWGLPTSAPAADPNNPHFVYQRFQNGILQFDSTAGTTQALPMGEYLKAILTGQNLPPDLASEAASSPLLRAVELTTADLTGAFVPDVGSF